MRCAAISIEHFDLCAVTNLFSACCSNRSLCQFFCSFSVFLPHLFHLPCEQKYRIEYWFQCKLLKHDLKIIGTRWTGRIPFVNVVTGYVYLCYYFITGDIILYKVKSVPDLTSKWKSTLWEEFFSIHITPVFCLTHWHMLMVITIVKLDISTLLMFKSSPCATKNKAKEIKSRCHTREPILPALGQQNKVANQWQTWSHSF